MQGQLEAPVIYYHQDLIQKSVLAHHCSSWIVNQTLFAGYQGSRRSMGKFLIALHLLFECFRIFITEASERSFIWNSSEVKLKWSPKKHKTIKCLIKIISLRGDKLVFKNHQFYVLKPFLSSILNSNDIDPIWLTTAITKRVIRHFSYSTSSPTVHRCASHGFPKINNS